MPFGHKVLPLVKLMKRKRDIVTKRVSKWKVSLNIHGGKQEFGVNYTETYSPVVNWITEWLILMLSLIHKWQTRQVDFVLVFPQADLECPMFMELPKGIEFMQGNSKSHVLELLKKLYGQKQAGRVLDKSLHNKLLSIGFQQFSYDKCLYNRQRTIFAVYVNIMESLQVQMLQTLTKL